MAKWGDLNIARMQGTRQSLAGVRESRRAGRESLNEALDRIRQTLMWGAGKKQEREESALERTARADLQTTADVAAMERLLIEQKGFSERQAKDFSAKWLLAQQGQKFEKDVQQPFAAEQAKLVREGAMSVAEFNALSAAERAEAQREWEKTVGFPHDVRLANIRGSYGEGGPGELPDQLQAFAEALALLRDMPGNEQYYVYDPNTNSRIWVPPEEEHENLRNQFAQLIQGYPEKYRSFMTTTLEAFLRGEVPPELIDEGGTPFAWPGDQIFGSDITQAGVAPPSVSVPEPGSPEAANLPLASTGPFGPEGIVPKVQRFMEADRQAAKEKVAGAASDVADFFRRMDVGVGNIFGARPQGAPEGAGNAIQTISDNLKRIKQIMKNTPGPNWGDQTTVNALLTDLEDGKIDKKNFTKKYEELKKKWLNAQ